MRRAAGRQEPGLFVLQTRDAHTCQALDFHLNCFDSDGTVCVCVAARPRGNQRCVALLGGQHRVTPARGSSVGLRPSGHLPLLCCLSGSLRCLWACLPFRSQVCETARSVTDNSSDDSDGTEQAKAGPDKKGGGMLAACRQIEMGTG